MRLRELLRWDRHLFCSYIAASVFLVSLTCTAYYARMYGMRVYSAHGQIKPVLREMGVPLDLRVVTVVVSLLT